MKFIKIILILLFISGCSSTPVVPVFIDYNALPKLPELHINDYAYNERQRVDIFDICDAQQHFAFQMKNNAENGIPFTNAYKILKHRMDSHNPRYKINENEFRTYIMIIEMAYNTPKNKYAFTYEVFNTCMASRGVDPAEFIIPNATWL